MCKVPTCYFAQKYQAQVAAAPVLIRLGGYMQACRGASGPVLLVDNDGPMAVDMRLTGVAAVAGATAANFVGGNGLPGKDILG